MGSSHSSSAAHPVGEAFVAAATAIRRRRSAQAARMSSAKSSTNRMAQISRGPENPWIRRFRRGGREKVVNSFGAPQRPGDATVVR
ncbi:hypothetical protein ABZ079_35485 [Streptomyces sp. NPDC006314]|uniref:hypothetical protein n=1 Tax=Streptomyces sp. NPDC006314 TaxID=3154475 RepID=UPI0033B7C5F4